MEKDEKNPSAFAQALLDSGYRFDFIAQKEKRLHKIAKRKAAAYFAAGVCMLGVAAYDASPRLTADIAQDLAVSGSVFAAGYSLYKSRQHVQEAYLYRQEIPNTLSLHQLAESARRARS